MRLSTAFGKQRLTFLTQDDECSQFCEILKSFEPRLERGVAPLMGRDEWRRRHVYHVTVRDIALSSPGRSLQ